MSLSTKNDYYAVLGVSRKADVETVKAAWKKLARLKHPDKNPGNPHATAEFQKLESAYSTLSDPDQRRAYDRDRFASFSNATKSKPSKNRQSRSRPPPRPQERCPPTTPPLGEASRLKTEAEARLKSLLAKKAVQEAKITRVRRHADMIAREVQTLVQAAQELEMIEKESYKHRSQWKHFVATVAPNSSQKRQLEEEKQMRDRRRLNNRAATHIKTEQAEREYLALRHLETGLKSIQQEIQDIIQGLEDREKAERMETVAKWKQWQEFDRVRRQAKKAEWTTHHHGRKRR